MTHASASDDIPGKTLIRSGTAARLAGLSPSTLRVWEHRYGVVAPPKSAAGQRTYSMRDIERLRLIKRLTVEGHAIGSVAHLDIEALIALSSGNQVATAGALRVLVVGQSAAQKLEGRLRPAPAHVFDDMAHIEREVAGAGAADVLLIHAASLHPSMVERVMALRSNLPAAHVVVVYSFGAQAVAEALAAADMTVCREPLSGRELAAVVFKSRPIPESLASDVPSSPRRYSDAELVALAEMPSTIACECPRHMAEIIALLVGFEAYSMDCANRSAKDAALHKHLHDVTGAARSMLEGALHRLVIEERLVL